MPTKKGVYAKSVYKESAPIHQGDDPFRSMMERFNIAADILELESGFYDYLCKPAHIHITSNPVVMEYSYLNEVLTP